MTITDQIDPNSNLNLRSQLGILRVDLCVQGFVNYTTGYLHACNPGLRGIRVLRTWLHGQAKFKYSIAVAIRNRLRTVIRSHQLVGLLKQTLIETCIIVGDSPGSIHRTQLALVCRQALSNFRGHLLHQTWIIIQISCLATLANTPHSSAVTVQTLLYSL